MSLFSWDYQDLPEADQWFLMARAYLDCSVKLFCQIRDGSLKQSYYHAGVGAFLFEHSVELFLKAAIVQAGKKVQAHHEIGMHYNQFKNLYPGNKYEFEGRINDVARSDSKRPHSEFHRYPTDNSGMLWQVNSHFDLEIWSEQLSLFAKDFDRLEPLIKERYPET
jgi:hypothetical protein